MSIKIKHRILSMDTDIFQVFVEETNIFWMWQFFKIFLWVTGMYLCHEFGLPQNVGKTFTFVQNILIGFVENEGQISIDRRIVAVLSSINAELDKWKFDFNITALVVTNSTIPLVLKYSLPWYYPTAKDLIWKGKL